MDKDKIDQYVEAIQDGDLPVVLVDADGRIIDGNHRIAATRKD